MAHSRLYLTRKEAVRMAKVQNTYKGFLDFESEFSHRYACWANNHRGWAKMKAFNKRVAKRRRNRRLDMEVREDEQKF